MKSGEKLAALQEENIRPRIKYDGGGGMIWGSCASSWAEPLNVLDATMEFNLCWKLLKKYCMSKAQAQLAYVALEISLVNC